jgi:uncharacterized membrane protein
VLNGLLLFVHVMGAIMWLGGGWVFQIFTERAVATDNLERIKGLVEDGERLGKSYFGPLSPSSWLPDCCSCSPPIGASDTSS